MPTPGSTSSTDDVASASRTSAATTAVVVLAAGQGTRFRSDTAKVLHRAAGRSLVGHVLEAVRPLGFGQVVVVVGHQAEAVTDEVTGLGVPNLVTVVQHEQRGTGHAVQQAMPTIAPGIERVVVLAGDTPLLTSGWLETLLTASDDAPAAMLTALLDDPSGYGRVLRSPAGTVERIVEHKDATDDERAVTEINAGMYAVRHDLLVDALARLDDDNAQGEIYLTDVVGILTGDGRAVAASVAPERVVAGVNDRAQLAAAAGELRRARLQHLMTEVGVTVVDPATTYLDADVEVGRDAILLPNTILEGGTRIGARAVVGPNTHLTNCSVGPGATVHSTRGLDAVVGERASVGPFAHLRAGTVLGERTKIGAYVETKNAAVGDGSKIPHLAYIGDATIGTEVNVACGVITVNYDGQTKSHTTIHDGAFVGCDTMLIAPVTVGAGAYTAAGSTITDDVPAGALAIARSRQTVKDGWAAQRRG